MLGFSGHDVKVAALGVLMVLLVQNILPGLWPTPRIPDTSYRANPNTLQKHVEYFDRNHDGLISVPETFESLYALGYKGLFNNIHKTWIIHSGLTMKGFVDSFPAGGPLTLSWWSHLLSFDFQLRIPIQTIQSLKHPSDSGTYDGDGEFVQERFDRMLEFDKSKRGGINSCELYSFIDSNNKPPNALGNFGSKFEYGAAYELLHDGRGVMSRDKLLKLYNGSLFYEIEEKVRGAKIAPKVDARKLSLPVEAT